MGHIKKTTTLDTDFKNLIMELGNNLALGLKSVFGRALAVRIIA